MARDGGKDAIPDSSGGSEGVPVSRRTPTPDPSNDGCLLLIDRFLDLVPDDSQSWEQREEIAEDVASGIAFAAIS